MILGRSILSWLITILIAVCVFVVARWLIPVLFGLVGIDIPGQVVTVLALLIAILVVYGGYSYRGRAVAP